MSALSSLSDQQLHRLLTKERLKAEIRDRLFVRQLQLIDDPSRFKSATCSRRAGKSTCGAHYCVLELIDCGWKDYVVYAAESFEQAKSLCWPDIAKLLSDLDIESQLGWKVSEGKGTIETPEGGTFICMGLNNEGQISKPRGKRARLFIIDEVQEFEDLLTKLWRDVIAPMLGEADGTLLVMGTPGYAMAGAWFSISQGNEGFRRHHWTVLDNPHFERVTGKSPRAWLDETMRMRKCDESDPAFMREFLGLWAVDGSMLVHPYGKLSPVPSHWRLSSVDWCRERLVTTMSIDWGWTDSTAIVVLASEKGSSGQAFVVHAEKKPRQTTKDLVDMIKEPMQRWSPQGVYCDHQNQHTVLDFNNDHAEELGVYIQQADKTDKDHQIAEINAQMKAEQLLIAEGHGDALYEEMQRWVYRDELRRRTRGEDHLCDALRYAFKQHPRSVDEDRARPAQWELDRDERNRQARNSDRLDDYAAW